MVVAVDGNAYLIAEPLLEATLQAILPSADRANSTDGSDGSDVTDLSPHHPITPSPHQVLRRVEGADLAGLVFRHPLFDRASPALLADYVTMDTGTGIVHTAPGHGKEDFETGHRYGLEVLNPVGASGRYTADAGEFGGRSFEGLRVTTFGPP